MACLCNYKFGQQGLLEPENPHVATRRCNPGLFLFNVLATPFLLTFHSVRIYVLPCVAVLISRLGCFFCTRLCGSCNCWKYSDKAFPADDSSLGAFEARKAGQVVVWKRGSQLTGDASKAARLFENGVEPSDICQGTLGDCWLLSALACLAEFDGAIEKVFDNREYSSRGKYRVRLFDRQRSRFVAITVDDLFPCDEKSGAPLFTQPNGEELWVMILEKAFAKLCGSYAALEGGHTLFALEALTGERVYKFHRAAGEQSWKKFGMEHKPTKENKRAVEFRGSGESLDQAAMFKLIKKLDQQDCVMGAGTLGKDATLREGRGDAKAGGIVPGHAYTIMAVRELVSTSGPVKLLKIRNPWGSFEWKGAWSDDAPEWRANPLVRAQVRPASGDDDGVFYMAWEDFLAHFDNIDVCLRTSGLDDLSLDVKEELGTCGPCVGCAVGCAKYWLLCHGCRAMWCGKDSYEHEETIRQAEMRAV